MKKLLMTLCSLLLICGIVRAQDDNYDDIVALAKQSFLQQLFYLSNDRMNMDLDIGLMESRIKLLETTHSPTGESSENRCTLMATFAFEWYDLRTQTLQHAERVNGVIDDTISSLPECGCTAIKRAALEEELAWGEEFLLRYEELRKRAAQAMPEYAYFIE